MKLKIKGFVTIEDYIANRRDTISPIGEISTYSLTYAEDKEIYLGGVNNRYVLYSFSSVYENGTLIEVPEAFRSQIFSITEWLRTEASGETSINSSQILCDRLNEHFAEVAGNFEAGDLIELTGARKFPERLKWKNKSIPITSHGHLNEITIWFSDAAFASQYDEYKLIVVPPIDSLDDFFLAKDRVASLVSARTLSKTLLKISDAKGSNPETLLVSEDYVYVARDGTKINTSWTVLIYGKQGNDKDVIRQAIKNHLLRNSSHAETEWRSAFPDLYTNSEFFIYPRWHNVAIPERLLYSGTYSSVISLNKELGYLKLRHPEYNAEHIHTNAQAFSCNYKSISVIALGGKDNKNNEYAITDVYPDLINVPFTDTMFDIMSEETRNWITEIEAMVIIAERATNYTSIPTRMKKLERNGILYISQRLGNHDFLVACKKTTPAYLEV